MLCVWFLMYGISLGTFFIILILRTLLIHLAHTNMYLSSKLVFRVLKFLHKYLTVAKNFDFGCT